MDHSFMENSEFAGLGQGHVLSECPRILKIEFWNVWDMSQGKGRPGSVGNGVGTGLGQDLDRTFLCPMGVAWPSWVSQKT